MCFNQQVMYVIYYIRLFQWMMIYGSMRDILDLATFSNAFLSACHSVAYPFFSQLYMFVRFHFFFSLFFLKRDLWILLFIYFFLSHPHSVLLTYTSEMFVPVSSYTSKLQCTMYNY